MLLLVPGMAGFSQQAPAKDLQIGQQLPAAVWNRALATTGNAVTLSSFKGQLLILDFWATWCKPCVAAFPKNDSLQKKYANQVQILPVTSEKKEVVKLFFNKMQASKHAVPHTSVTDDSIIRRWLPHNTLPHCVWLDKQGTIKAITYGYQVTADNIDSMLYSNQFALRVKKDNFSKLNYSKPIFFDSIQTPIDLQEVCYTHDSTDYKSILLKGVTGQAIMGYPAYRVYAIDLPIFWLYNTAFSMRKPALTSPNRVILEVKDSSLFNYWGSNKEEFDKWKTGKLYSYELISKDSSGNGLSSEYELGIMQKELNAYFARFNIHGSLEKRKITCHQLVTTGSTDKLFTKGKEASVTKNDFYYKMTNSTLKTFITDLTLKYWQRSPLPIVDGTNFTEPVDLEINAQLSSLEELNKELARYNLKIEPIIKEMDMIVIKQN